MALVSLQITNFRCIEQAELTFDSRCTVIFGDNAAGKTSILEAIHVLSCGRSFRSNHLEILQRSSGEAFLVLGKVVADDRLQTLGLRWSPVDREIRAGGVTVQGFANLAAALPVQVIDPSAHKLLEDGPSRRRKFMDWGLFHVEQTFMNAWQRYQRALTQRNAALKAQKSPNLVIAWNEQLSTAGEEIGRLRRRYLTAIEPLVQAIAEAVLGISVTLKLEQGWDEEVGLARTLELSLPKDLRYRNTTVGPHRADVEICADDLPAKDRVSRGQQKLLACSLTLAQLQYRVERGLPPASLLLDDPAAELDVNNLGKLLTAIAKIPAQIIATAVDPIVMDVIAPARRFHVKQGSVTQVL